jgi:hypothetical protein
MSLDKRQFLDPISTISKIILLHFHKPKTRIRITDHVIELIEYDDTVYHYGVIPESVVSAISRTICKDSRNDICVLLPVFIRFIELYLLEKEKVNDECYKYLVKLGEYAIVGMRELQKTYGYDNASFTLQYYISLLREGIDKKYTKNSLPEHLRDLTSNNLLDDKKVRSIWIDEHIIQLGQTFEKYFNAENDVESPMKQILLSSNKDIIMKMLEYHDSEFKKMLETDVA